MTQGFHPLTPPKDLSFGIPLCGLRLGEAQSRGGQENDSRFGHRFRGEGPYAEMVGQRVRLAGKRLGFSFGRMALNREDFRPPGAQLSLF